MPDYVLNWWGNGTATTTSTYSNVVYQVPVYTPEPVVTLAKKPAKPKAAETPEEWLRRRIDEICWVPE